MSITGVLQDWTQWAVCLGERSLLGFRNCEEALRRENLFYQVFKLGEGRSKLPWSDPEERELSPTQGSWGHAYTRAELADTNQPAVVGLKVDSRLPLLSQLLRESTLTREPEVILVNPHDEPGYRQRGDRVSTHSCESRCVLHLQPQCTY